MKSVVVLSDARADLESGRDFYNAQHWGVGDYFISSLLSDLDSLSNYSGIHPRHFGFNRMLARRFPWGIYYTEGAGEVRVIAILDLRRNPRWLRVELTRRR